MVLLKKIELNEEIPGYASHHVGIGALVVNKQITKILMVKEKSANYGGFWKIPTGLVERKEKIADAVARELLEETGIKGRNLGLISIREKFPLSYELNDLFFVFLFVADDE